jgi:type IV secretory pathway VirB10-like protein
MKENFQQDGKDASDLKETHHIRRLSISKVYIASPEIETEHQGLQHASPKNQQVCNGEHNATLLNNTPSKPIFAGIERQPTDPEQRASGKYRGVDTKTTEDLCFSLGMSRRDVQKLKRKFDQADLDKTYVLSFYYTTVI